MSNLPVDIPIWKMKNIGLPIGEENNSLETTTILTGFVRERYLRHLKSLLLKNYTTCSYNQPTPRVFSETDIEICAREMEHGALHECMVVQLYQKAISTMVKDIKKHTDHHKLHKTFENYTSPQMEKYTQTEINVVEQTQPLPDLIGRFENVDSDPHINDMGQLVSIKHEPYSSSPECNETKVEEEPVVNHTDFRTSHCCTSQSKTRNQDEVIKSHLPKYNKNSSIQHKSKENVPLVVESKYPPLDERLANLLNNENSLSSDAETEPTPHLDALFFDLKELDFPYLDERLAEIHGESSKKEPERKWRPVIKRVTSWRTERETNERMLNSLMTRFTSQLKRQRMAWIFYKLFEPKRKKVRKTINENIGKHSTISSPVSQLVIAKKKLGRRVVKHLMPYYGKEQILSREQFKYAASQITDKLILQSDAPEEKIVEQSVRNFFRKNSSFNKVV